MMFHPLRRLAALLMGSRDAPRTDAAQGAESSESRSQKAERTALDFDPMWHGDHWQNLLSSPMDARHYVMEDWSFSPPLDVATGSR